MPAWLMLCPSIKCMLTGEAVIINTIKAYDAVAATTAKMKSGLWVSCLILLPWPKTIFCFGWGVLSHNKMTAGIATMTAKAR